MRKLPFLCGFALAVLVQPALASTGLEKLEEGLRVARACGADVRKLCKGVRPGEGRIAACMKQNMQKLSPDCAEHLLMAKALDQGPAKVQQKPGAIAGTTLDLSNARDYAYCEIAPFVILEGKITAEFYNTSGTTGVGGGCPPDKFAAIDGNRLAADFAAATVYLNPTPLTARRHWVMDRFWAAQKGETVDFYGVSATWGASMDPTLLAGMVRGNYEPGQIHRNTKYTYLKGSPVFLLRAPSGKTWVMQSYAIEVDASSPTISCRSLETSSNSFQTGWKFEVKTFGQGSGHCPHYSGRTA